jgi:hypothetical protein
VSFIDLKHAVLLLYMGYTVRRELRRNRKREENPKLECG